MAWFGEVAGSGARRLEGGSMDLVIGEIEQRRNSTPLDRTREAEGGGCGGWSGKDPEKDLVKWRRRGTILLKFRVCQNGLGVDEYIHHGLG